MRHFESVLRGKFIALSTYLKSLKKSHTSDLTAHLKAVEQKGTNSPSRSRHQEKIIRSYFKNLYCTKLENLKEMNNFPERYHIPKLNQEQISNLNRPIVPKEIEVVNKSLQNKNSLWSGSFRAELYQNFKEE